MAEELILDLADAVKEKFDKELKPIKTKLAELTLKLQNIEKVIGLLIFGVIFLIIGLIAYFYKAEHSPFYPYQTLGAILSVAGVIFIALAFLYPLRRLPPQP